MVRVGGCMCVWGGGGDMMSSSAQGRRRDDTRATIQTSCLNNITPHLAPSSGKPTSSVSITRTTQPRPRSATPPPPLSCVFWGMVVVSTAQR